MCAIMEAAQSASSRRNGVLSALETVSLGGKYFTPRVKDGDKVKAGDLLMEFDLDSMKKDFKIFTPVLVTNADDYASVDMIGNYGPAKVGEPIYTAKA